MAKLPPGRYRAKVLYHTMTVNSAGNPELRLNVLPYAGAEIPTLPPGYTPVPITIFLTITPGTMGEPGRPGWVLETLKHLGFKSQDLTILDPSSDTPHVFTGREVQILGTEDEFKGKKRTRWNILRNETESQPLATSALSALSSRYANVLATLLPKESDLPPGTQTDQPPF